MKTIHHQSTIHDISIWICHLLRFSNLSHHHHTSLPLVSLYNPSQSHHVSIPPISCIISLHHHHSLIHSFIFHPSTLLNHITPQHRPFFHMHHSTICPMDSSPPPIFHSKPYIISSHHHHFFLVYFVVHHE